MANSDCHLIELYHNLFLPDYDNGLLYWKPNPHKTLAWNNKFADQRVNFCTSKTSRPTAKPYYVLWANGKNHRVNRVIYIMGNEKIPDMVDHENHDTLDNRLVNLYDVSNKENSRNRGLLTHTTRLDIMEFLLQKMANIEPE